MKISELKPGDLFRLKNGKVCRYIGAVNDDFVEYKIIGYTVKGSSNIVNVDGSIETCSTHEEVERI